MSTDWFARFDAPTHPQPSIYETTVATHPACDVAISHDEIELIGLHVPWTLDAANARVTQAMRDAGWTDHDGVMVEPANPRRTRKAVTK